MDSLHHSADRLAVILPFEERLWRERGFRAHFVGHPSMDLCRWETAPLSSARPRLAVLCGSRDQEADAVVEAVDTNKPAQEASAGILKPIYRLAEAFSFPAFHWIAFSVMVTGVVSFVLQLTLGKLVVLARRGFSPAEILSDAFGLVVVSLVGLVFTTQAAA